MAGVGAASGSAPGSLYQYFPNRDLLIEALAEREAARVDACVADALAAWVDAGQMAPKALVDALLPPLLALYRDRPVWSELLHALSRRGQPGPVEERLDARIEAQLAAALARLDPAATALQRRLAATVLLDLGHAGLLLAVASPAGGAYEEVRRALIAYLRDWLDRGDRD